jgi:hypothetical protein
MPGDRSDAHRRTGVDRFAIGLSAANRRAGTGCHSFVPAGHTTAGDTGRFFDTLNAICQSGCVDRDRFVLVEDYTLHTGSDYEGRIAYIERMIHEVRPLAVIFITRAYYWRLNIRLGMALARWALRVHLVEAYEQALQTASDILGRPLLHRQSGVPPQVTDEPASSSWNTPRESVFIPSSQPISDAKIMYAVKWLSTLQWDEFGFHADPALLSDPEYAPLMVALGSLKSDIDDFLATREEEIADLEATVERAAQLSGQIEAELSQAEAARHLAEQLAVSNQKLSTEISTSQVEVFLVLADNVDVRSGVEKGYTRQVAHQVRMLALRIGFDTQMARTLHDAALLHHIGFLGIPDHADGLDPDHCHAGKEVLGRIDGEVARMAQDMAAYHHEHFDGTGFPFGLAGEQIPMAARILSVASFRVKNGTIVSTTVGRELDPDLAAAAETIPPDCARTLQ